MATYEYWESALAGTFLPIHDSDPQLGFFRIRQRKSGGYDPVAIWQEGEDIIAVSAGKQADAAAIWSYVADKPISEQRYRDYITTGKWWDEDDSVTASLLPPPAGHNQPDAVDSIKDQIAAALAGVDAYAEVKDDATAAKAQSLRSRLLELSREADREREKLKRPHFEAGKAVDDLYQPLVKTSKTGADAIAKALGAHETRKAQEAAKAAKLADDARRKAQEEAQARAPIGVTVDPISEPTPPPPVSAPIKGAYGRGASVRVVKIAVVKDQDAAYLALKSQPDLAAMIQKLAQKMVDAGFTLAGVEIEEQRKVS